MQMEGGGTAVAQIDCLTVRQLIAARLGVIDRAGTAIGRPCLPTGRRTNSSADFPGLTAPTAIELDCLELWGTEALTCLRCRSARRSQGLAAWNFAHGRISYQD